MNHRRHRKVVYATLIIIILIAVEITFAIPISLFLQDSQTNALETFTLLFACLNTFRLFYITQFVFATLTVKIRFSSLNNHLKGFETNVKVANIVVSKHELSPKYREFYLKLCDGITIINGTFTLQIGFLFGSFLVAIEEQLKFISSE